MYGRRQRRSRDGDIVLDLEGLHVEPAMGVTILVGFLPSWFQVSKCQCFFFSGYLLCVTG